MKKESFRHPTALIHPSAQLGEGTRVWAFVNIQEGAKIGEGCNVCDGCYIEGGSVVGNHVTLKNGVNVFEGVTIEDDVFVGANVAFINDRFPRSNRNDQWVLEKVLVKKGATIGSNATLLCGLTIGEYAFVGAGSVVTRDIPSYTMVAGNPAKPRGHICRCGKKLPETLQCVCGQAYEAAGDGLQPKSS